MIGSGMPVPYQHLFDAAVKRDYIERYFIETFAQRGNFQIELAVKDDANLQMEQFISPFMDNDKYFHKGSIFYEECYVMILSPPQVYTSYEKMILPFDIQSWIGILITFGVGFFVIILSRLKFKNFYNFLVGENVKYTSFNLIIIFFGSGMTKLPENNFARIILAVFIYFCLIIRTGYQGEI
jgi:hypothetical protein